MHVEHATRQPGLDEGGGDLDRPDVDDEGHDARDRPADGEGEQDREEAQEEPELRDQLQGAQQHRSGDGVVEGPEAQLLRDLEAGPDQEAGDHAEQHPDAEEGRHGPVHDAEQGQDVRPDRLRKHASGPALDGALVGHHGQDPGRDHEEAEQVGGRSEDPEDLVRDHGGRLVREALEDALQVGRGLGHDGERDRAHRLGDGAQLGLQAGDPGLDVGRRRKLAGDDDQAVQQGRNHEQRHPHEQPDGEQLREESGQDARHEPVEPVGDGQDRVGQDRADDERQQRRPRGHDQLHRHDGEREADGSLGQRLGTDRPQAVREDVPAHACARPRRGGGAERQGWPSGLGRRRRGRGDDVGAWSRVRCADREPPCGVRLWTGAAGTRSIR